MPPSVSLCVACLIIIMILPSCQSRPKMCYNKNYARWPLYGLLPSVIIRYSKVKIFPDSGDDGVNCYSFFTIPNQPQPSSLYYCRSRLGGNAPYDKSTRNHHRQRSDRVASKVGYAHTRHPAYATHTQHQCSAPVIPPRRRCVRFSGVTVI